jgi:hypothetical protein
MPQNPSGSGSNSPPTPLDERVPKFPHECLSYPDQSTVYQPPDREQTQTNPAYEEETQETIIDLQDPMIEKLPSDRASILQQVRTSQTRLAEDETSIDGIPPSPVVGATRHPEDLELSVPPPAILALSQERSPSLESINEEEGLNLYQNRLLAIESNGMSTDELCAANVIAEGTIEKASEKWYISFLAFVILI